jgi:hypothetical protein
VKHLLLYLLAFRRRRRTLRIIRHPPPPHDNHPLLALHLDRALQPQIEIPPIAFLGDPHHPSLRIPQQRRRTTYPHMVHQDRPPLFIPFLVQEELTSVANGAATKCRPLGFWAAGSVLVEGLLPGTQELRRHVAIGRVHDDPLGVFAHWPHLVGFIVDFVGIVVHQLPGSDDL